jgi:hypothetical protein
LNHLLEIFVLEKTCTYKGEKYYVRDNGAVFRCRKENRRKRPLDEEWTFGRPDTRNGYLKISSETVHRIVATAFHGEQPSEKHVVDHIDTNKKNNRPENLRWLTRLENILLNPITLSRIIFKYGSIDNFLKNPANPIDGRLEQNVEWMRTVTKEESDNAKRNLMNWAQEGKIPKSGQLGEWVFSKINYQIDTKFEDNPITESLTPNAIQKNWKTPNEFPNCPSLMTESVIREYSDKLLPGGVFARNKYGKSTVETKELSEKENELFVISKSENVKPFALAKVFIEKDNVVHESLGTFFEFNGARKAFTLAIGQEWKGGETFDDLLD